MKTVELEQLILVKCGIDIDKDVMVATIRSSTKYFETRSFTGFTSSVISTHDWLQEKHVSHVAMESTEIYWNAFSIY